jgi:hypothetical protein
MVNQLFGLLGGCTSALLNATAASMKVIVVPNRFIITLLSAMQLAQSRSPDFARAKRV